MTFFNKHIEKFNRVSDNYKQINKVCSPVYINKTKIVGRDISELSSSLKNILKPNVVLLGEPGVGKSAYVEAFAKSEYGKDYLTLAVDVELFMDDPMGNKDAQIANGFIDLFKDVKQYCIDNDVLVVLFIDEFHKIIKLSSAAMQTIKPILEQAGRNGIKFVVATTFEEYTEFVSNDRALDERFTRINLQELEKSHVLNILRDILKIHKIEHLADETIFNDIYDVSKQIYPSRSQPRVSIDILSVMIGEIMKSEKMVDGEVIREYKTPSELHINSDYPLCWATLSKVVNKLVNIDINNNIDIRDLENALYSRLLGQETAINQILNGFNNVVAGFSSTDRPRYSFLSTGSTGVGKTELAKIICEKLGLPMVRFDMSMYPRTEDAVRFANELSLAAWSKPNAFILLDEVEKSCKEVINILLQVLDDARLTMANNSNNVASFVGCIINMTTNVASDVYSKHKDFARKGTEINTDVISKALIEDSRFESAVLGRIDKIVPFMPLDDTIMMGIAGTELFKNLDKIETKKRKVFVSHEVLHYVVRDKLSNNTESGGARDAKRQIYSLALSKVSYHLNHNRDCENSLYLCVDGVARFKDSSTADADSAWLTVGECYNKENVSKILAFVSHKLNRKIYDKGLVIPIDTKPEDIIRELLFAFQDNPLSYNVKSIFDGVVPVNYVFGAVEPEENNYGLVI